MNALVEGPFAYSADLCVPQDSTTHRLQTAEGIEYVRSDESSFVNFTDYPWEPLFAIIDGMRMHYIDAGPKDSTEVVLMLHGQPTWSYLYRKMVPILTGRGFRVICPDWLGMGKSDKPTSILEHTYLKQVARLKDFIRAVLPESLDAPKINVFFQDWGSLIGFRVVGDEPQWFRRVISANGNFPVFPTGLNTLSVPKPVNYNCSDTRSFREHIIDRFSSSPCGLDQSCFSLWIEYALTAPKFSPADVLNTISSIDTDSAEAYDAPFPNQTFMAAVRAFPSMIATVIEPEFGNTKAWESLQNFSRPFLALAGEEDRSLGSEATQNRLIDNILGSRAHSFEHRRYANAGHFIQEDAGEIVAEYVADFIEGTAFGDLRPPSDPPVPTLPMTFAESGAGNLHSVLTALMLSLCIFHIQLIHR